jgi:hypothetical protein
VIGGACAFFISVDRGDAALLDTIADADKLRGTYMMNMLYVALVCDDDDDAGTQMSALQSTPLMAADENQPDNDRRTQ